MKKKRLLAYLISATGALLFLIVVINFSIYAAVRSYISTSVESLPQAEAVLIPGAAVFGRGNLTDIFEDRVDTAISLYRLGKVSKFLVSGDNSTVSHNEVNPVRKYLLREGIPDEDIFLDHAGFDTYSTMYRARDVFHVSSVIISTQSFHLSRAVFLARSLGINAYGIPADNRSVALKNYIRESLASEKALLDLVTHRKPKYLGDVIPIRGDGRNYP